MECRGERHSLKCGVSLGKESDPIKVEDREGTDKIPIIITEISAFNEKFGFSTMTIGKVLYG